MSFLEELKAYERKSHAEMMTAHKRLGDERTLEAADAFATAANEWWLAAELYDREVFGRLSMELKRWQTSAGVSA